MGYSYDYSMDVVLFQGFPDKFAPRTSLSARRANEDVRGTGVSVVLLPVETDGSYLG